VSDIDSALSVQTPEGIEFLLYPAGLPIRACAYAIDMLLQWTLIIILWITTILLGQNTGMWFLLILIFALDWLYHAFWEVFARGQSLGKRIMGIRVVRSDGSPVNAGASFLRNLLRFADTFMFLYLIAFVCISASRGFRRLGDWAADTLVVYTAHALAASSVKRGRGPAETDAFAPSRPLSYEEKQAILMFARRYPLLGKERADEIARDYARSLGNDTISDSAYLLGLARKIEGDVI
jgi:uncharacterized RDD family membrane protein YckC